MSGRFEDDDIKIAPDDLSQLFKVENPVADDNIDLFIRQRGLGNTEKARALGMRFVEELLDCVWTKPPEGVDATTFDLQLKLLFAYAVHRIVEDYSPNSIVAQGTLSSFYEQLEADDRELYRAVNNCPAFSLYLYLHRSGEECAETVGKVFAKLCGMPDNADCAMLGEGGYARFYSACAQQMLTAGYTQ
ncbi:MAG: hypothetical protein RR135_06390 [Oscillospiraceae bacterium]